MNWSSRQLRHHVSQFVLGVMDNAMRFGQIEARIDIQFGIGGRVRTSRAIRSLAKCCGTDGAGLPTDSAGLIGPHSKHLHHEPDLTLSDESMITCAVIVSETLGLDEEQ